MAPPRPCTQIGDSASAIEGGRACPGPLSVAATHHAGALEVMMSSSSEDRARQHAAKAEKLFVQQVRADEAVVEQRNAEAARDQKTARLREQRLAAEAAAAAEKASAPAKKRSAKPSGKVRQTIGD